MPTSSIAFFSMEVGLESDLPTYSGGLGVLTGDILWAAADLGLSMVGVSFMPSTGIFSTTSGSAWQSGGQSGPMGAGTYPETIAHPRCRPPPRAQCLYTSLAISHYWVDGPRSPCILLDTDLPENDPSDRRLTDRLYGGDATYRLCQEAILGMGGLEVLTALGYETTRRSTT